MESLLAEVLLSANLGREEYYEVLMNLQIKLRLLQFLFTIFIYLPEFKPNSVQNKPEVHNLSK